MNESAPIQLGILVSGGGTTMINLAQRIEVGALHAAIPLVIASNAKAKGVERAQDLGLPTEIVVRKQFDSVEAFSDRCFELLRQAGVDLVVLAGFLSLLRIPDDFEGKVINIHPALLPKYGGKGMYGHHVHEAVLAAGETESGCTVHFADNEYDNGPIILQAKVPVLPDDTPDTLAERVMAAERDAYPQAIAMIAAGEVRFSSPGS